MAIQTSDEILGCPWGCAADPEELMVNMEIRHSTPDISFEAYQVHCSCGATGPVADSREDAIAVWNAWGYR